MTITVKETFTVQAEIDPPLTRDQAVSWVNQLTDRMNQDEPGLISKLVGFLLVPTYDLLYVTFKDKLAALFFVQFIEKDEALRKRIGRSLNGR